MSLKVQPAPASVQLQNQSGVYNVHDFGAVGDGVTDDTAAIQTAIDTAITAKASLVYLPPGTYKISAALSITTNNIQFTLKGAGIGVTSITQSAVASDGISATGYLLSIENLTVTGPGTTSTGTGISLIGAAIIGRIILTRVQVSGFSIGFAFTGNSFDQMSLTHVNFGSNNSHGLSITPTASSALLAVRDSIFDNNGGAGFNIVPATLSYLLMQNVEAVNNSSGNILQSVLMASIDTLDVEEIPAGVWGLQLINVQSFLIRASEFLASNGAVANGGIYLASPGGSFGMVQACQFSPIADYTYGGMFINHGTNIAWQGNQDTNHNLLSPVLDGAGVQSGLVSLDTATNFSPKGVLAAPAVPASGTAYANGFGVACRVFVTGGTVSAIALNGTSTGLTSGFILVGAGETITLSYTAVPTWTWFGL